MKRVQNDDGRHRDSVCGHRWKKSAMKQRKRTRATMKKNITPVLTVGANAFTRICTTWRRRWRRWQRTEAIACLSSICDSCRNRESERERESVKWKKKSKLKFNISIWFYIACDAVMWTSGCQPAEQKYRKKIPITWQSTTIFTETFVYRTANT